MLEISSNPPPIYPIATEGKATPRPARPIITEAGNSFTIVSRDRATSAWPFSVSRKALLRRRASPGQSNHYHRR
jgi:hypothetical protein